MAFPALNADSYKHKNHYYNKELEGLLVKIIQCYKMLLNDEPSLPNNENKIRDILYLNYLNNNRVRTFIGLKDYYFDRETSENHSQGRTDIRILSSYSFIDTGAYYILECKRLDGINPTGTAGLNSKYINDGIKRFISAAYSSYYDTNGMIGFAVKSFDIPANISALNLLLINQFGSTNIDVPISQRPIAKGFDHSYYSVHLLQSKRLLLYHLILDVSSNLLT